jgi:hypothetical protein
MSDAIFPVGQTPGPIGGIPNVDSVLVLNSGHVDVIIDNQNDVSLDPQSGCRIEPGRSVDFPRNGPEFALFGVAAGPNAQVTIVIFPGDDDGEDDE